MITDQCPGMLLLNTPLSLDCAYQQKLGKNQLTELVTINCAFVEVASLGLKPTIASRRGLLTGTALLLLGIYQTVMLSGWCYSAATAA
ncbi:unnamed protein product [Ilex paraguariensis]|uniref:Uncharacterized protein n=1 Tax=Ilex paraguariensis TaxID=185542 RepID=A0ABC8UQR8_9AQUA